MEESMMAKCKTCWGHGRCWVPDRRQSLLLGGKRWREQECRGCGGTGSASEAESLAGLSMAFRLAWSRRKPVRRLARA